jgi:hypothetical protein
VDASTETCWFSVLCQFPFCLVQGRINFINGGGQKAVRPINGSVFVYLGKQQETFRQVFGRFGKVFSQGNN